MLTQKKSLSPKMKKALIYGGIAVFGLGLIYNMTLQTVQKETLRDPESISLTGNANTRAVSIEGLNRRLTDLEAGGQSGETALEQDVNHLRAQVTALTRSIETLRSSQQLAIDQAVEEALADVAVQPATVPREPSPRETDAPVPELGENPPPAPAHQRVASIYVTPRAPATDDPGSQPGTPELPAPKIRIYAAERPEPESPDLAAGLPDVHLPAGSILAAYLLTGLDAPTGTRAASQPVPVLMRIKTEAILPNHALADVTECHLLGAAYGDLGSQRVNIRGETVSCVLRDKTAIEGNVKFFVTGEDGKNGIKGRLVSRAGRVLAAAAGAALTQGLLASLDDTSTESIFLGGTSSSGAIAGASQGFDLLTEYYLDLAEQTFPVIEIINDRWVDVVLTEMLTIKWKG